MGCASRGTSAAASVSGPASWRFCIFRRRHRKKTRRSSKTMVSPATPPTTPPTSTGVGGMEELFALPAAADVDEDGALAVAVPPDPIPPPPPMPPPVLDDPLAEALALAADVIKVDAEAEALDDD